VVDEFDGKIHFVEIDIEQDRDIAENAGGTGTPTIQFLRTKMLLESKGIKPKSQYRQLIETICVIDRADEIRARQTKPRFH